MKPASIKGQRIKEVLTIYRRRDEIHKARRNLGYQKLEHPIRHGWYKEMIITQKVFRYKNYEAIFEICDKLEKHIWGKTKEEAIEKWNYQTSRHLIMNDIPTLSKKQYNKLSDAAKAICHSFRFYDELKRIKVRFYVKIPKSAYRIKYTRAYITHRRRIDPELERELSFLNGQLFRNGYYEIDEKLNSRKPRWRYINRSEKNYINSKLRGLRDCEVQELINEHISWERN